MIDDKYLTWFNDEFGYVDGLTWCSATSPHDVLAAYGVAATEAEPTTLALLPELRLLVGRLGKGTLVIQPNGCPTNDVLRPLAQYGPCLSVHWSDTTPPGITYVTGEKPAIFFDPFDWEFIPEPDIESVNKWISATPAGYDTWKDDWARAALITAESLFGEKVDEKWVRASHTGVPQNAS
ncbi:hypothetical protein [Streptosporangium saharense]|uniref:Uncharacterized protein n=1 Tax=Streptosporangium saharense TaxID=1706840 RepID=A0A7W7VKF6_9ACTN|nr:hypothetical protein [Streptosporangium saharense]MBB4913498.1 hypothetical protein [Streptosporangium saharense]